SSIANVLGAIKLAKHLGLGRDDVVLTVATDSAELYASERARYVARLFQGLDRAAAAEIFGAHLKAVATDHVLETTATDRRRIFNLGYFTWVEQQGIALDDFDARKDQRFWRDLQELVPVWDELITAFNQETRAAAA
ncbi:MAG: pyridoxal-5'-phosphate-dependent protein subunit beta, partial [Methyloligellaceae bacterium]